MISQLAACTHVWHYVALNKWISGKIGSFDVAYFFSQTRPIKVAFEGAMKPMVSVTDDEVNVVQ